MIDALRELPEGLGLPALRKIIGSSAVSVILRVPLRGYSCYHSIQLFRPITNPDALAIHAGDKGTLALWLLPDSRLRLLWQPEQRGVLVNCTSGRAATRGAPAEPPVKGVLAFTEDLARVHLVPSLQHLPEPAGGAPITSNP